MSFSRAGIFLTVVTTLTATGIAYIHYEQKQEREVGRVREIHCIAALAGQSSHC